MRKLSYEKMVTAMLSDDSSYDGKFYVCVKTTRIYCLPSCKAKLPLMKNIVFSATREDAIVSGYRGCKRCKSEFFPDVSPVWLEPVVTFMRNTVGNKINEQNLSDHAGVDISTIRRYFKSYLRTTPMAFHRKLRLEYARTLIERGTDYLTAAYECGFESSSGFRDAFVRQFGCSPGRIHAA